MARALRDVFEATVLHELTRLELEYGQDKCSSSDNNAHIAVLFRKVGFAPSS